MDLGKITFYGVSLIRALVGARLVMPSIPIKRGSIS